VQAPGQVWMGDRDVAQVDGKDVRDSSSVISP
jgi:hypothetical protein